MGSNVLTDVQYLPLCAGLTVIGLIVTYVVYRRQGLHAAARMLAWSLLPLGLGLAGAAKAIWQVIYALGSFAFHLAFSPSHWVGAALLAVSLVLFVATGAVSSARLRRLRGSTSDTPPRATAGGQGAGVTRRSVPALPAGTASPAPRKRGGAGASGAPAAVDPDMAEIEAILKQRGIG